MQKWKCVTRVAVVPRALLVGDQASGAAQGLHDGDQVGHQMQLIISKKGSEDAGNLGLHTRHF